MVITKIIITQCIDTVIVSIHSIDQSIKKQTIMIIYIVYYEKLIKVILFHPNIIILNIFFVMSRKLIV